MDNNTRFTIEMPVGCPAKLFVPLYASELRKKLASCLAVKPEEVRIKDVTKEKYAIRVMQGSLSGMEVLVGKGFTLVSNRLQMTVRVKPYSKTEDVLTNIAKVIWALLTIPTFFLVVPFVRFIFLSFIFAVLLLVPLALVIQAFISLVMFIAYKLFGNEFDAARRAALLDVLKQVPLPDPLARLRPATTNSGV